MELKSFFVLLSRFAEVARSQTTQGAVGIDFFKGLSVTTSDCGYFLDSLTILSDEAAVTRVEGNAAVFVFLEDFSAFVVDPNITGLIFGADLAVWFDENCSIDVHFVAVLAGDIMTFAYVYFDSVFSLNNCCLRAIAIQLLCDFYAFLFKLLGCVVFIEWVLQFYDIVVAVGEHEVELR